MGKRSMIGIRRLQAAVEWGSGAPTTRQSVIVHALEALQFAALPPDVGKCGVADFWQELT